MALTSLRELFASVVSFRLWDPLFWRQGVETSPVWGIAVQQNVEFHHIDSSRMHLLILLLLPHTPTPVCVVFPTWTSYHYSCRLYFSCIRVTEVVWGFHLALPNVVQEFVKDK